MANKEIVMIGVLLLYAVLPANSPIKAFLNKIIGGIIPTPTPTPSPNPDPNPTPNPVPVVGMDWQAILQLLMSVLLKAKASGDTKAMESVLAVMDQVKAEHDELVRSSLPPSVRYYVR